MGEPTLRPSERDPRMPRRLGRARRASVIPPTIAERVADIRREADRRKGDRS